MTNQQEYARYVKKHAARSPLLANCFAAFFVGGLICAGGQVLFLLYQSAGMDRLQSGTLVTVTLIFLSALLTGLGVFDRIARYAGAGTLVPVTGFANSVVSPAIDTKSEGLVLGVGSKIFTIAGPVLLYGVLFGALYGAVYFVVGLFH
ncbi:MAG: SpoVA/SpoVAEb family sporulation membrane protein [Eubacteriales bacterium]